MPLLFAAMLAVAPPINSQPSWTPPVHAEIPVRDEPYRGTILLEVDARRPVQNVLGVRETIPTAGAGRLTLRYPQWIQAAHAPIGAVGSIANLRFTAASKPLGWKRDAVAEPGRSGALSFVLVLT